MSVEAILEQIEAEAAAEATRRLAEARGRAAQLAGGDGGGGTRRPGPAGNAPGRAWPSRSPGSWDWRIEMYEYGNARIAALRGRLLGGPSLRRPLEGGGGAAAVRGSSRAAG